MILANGDTVHPVSVEQTLLAARGEGRRIILALDTVKPLADEEMKVVVEPGKGVRRITKLMDPAEATGEYIGVTLIEAEAAAELADALKADLRARPRTCTTRTATRSWSTAASPSTSRRSATSPGSRSTTTTTSPRAGRSRASTDPADPLAGRRRHPRRRPRRPGRAPRRPADLHLGQARHRHQRAARAPGCASGSPRPCPAPTGTRSAAAPSTPPSGSPTPCRASRYDAVVGLGGGKIIDVRQVRRGPGRACRWSPSPPTSRTTASARRSPPSTTTTGAAPTASRPRSPWSIDLDVIREAPARFVRAGIGDAVSNISAIADWELSHRDQRRADRRPGRRDGPQRRRGGAAAPGRHRRRRLPQRRWPRRWCSSGIAMSISGDTRPVLRRLPRDQPRLRPALPQAGRRARRAGRPRRGLRDAPARRPRGVGLIAEVLRRHGLPVLPAEIGFTVDEFVRGGGVTPRRPGPAATRSWNTSTCPTPRSGTHTPTMSRPSVAELRPVVHPPGVKDRRSGEHWAGRLYMRELSLRVDRLPGRPPGSRPTSSRT